MSLVSMQLICFQCTITEHNGHEYNLVKDIFEIHKQEIKTSLAPAKERLSAVRKASKCIQALKNEVLNRQGTLESKIYDDNRKLVDIITARTHEHVKKLRHITEEKVRDLDSQLEQLDTIETQLSSGVDMVEEILKVTVYSLLMNYSYETFYCYWAESLLLAQISVIDCNSAPK